MNFNPIRRDLLRLGVAGSALSLPASWAPAAAQESRDPGMLRLPRLALVIGNSGYAQSPLRNPANDAKGMAEALNALGFDVAVRLDAGQAAMRAAIEQFVTRLASRKAVGLFYFAGHGVQINWRNYLIPVDAEVRTNADIEARAIDVNQMIAGLGKTDNALNLIILDACRDAPFGEAARPGQRGLSQMDAPRSTLLAYATAPGNVANDGSGDHGLYTGHLLREMRAPEAKVEDVFKRVRLAVRRASNGAQIPWESTSLEDDFYFVPPARLTPPGDRERAERFSEELALWQRIESATSVADFEGYLQRFPSGNFSELAQFRLDRLLERQGERRIELASVKGNPYATPVMRANTAYRVGDTYAYRVSALAGGAAKGGVQQVVTDITDTEVHFNGGRLITDLLGNTRRFPDGRLVFGYQNVPAEYAVGKTWVTRFDLKLPNGEDGVNEMSFRIVARERITVPAGTFECYHVEGRGTSYPPLHGRWSVKLSTDVWLAPDQCRRPIRIEATRRRYQGGAVFTPENDRYELESFRQA